LKPDGARWISDGDKCIICGAMGKVYFIAGIDTGVGKTVATGMMARFLASRGTDATTVKMVQTGNDGFSEDRDAHRAMCGGARLPEDDEGLTAPQTFKFPSSPKLAAALEGRQVDLAAIESAVAACAARREVVLVEAAGGLLVPLADDVLSADFAAAMHWPAVLVTCGRLGAINHSLLSLEAMKSRGIPLAGIVHNWHPGADPAIDRDTKEEVARHARRLGFAAPLVALPRVPADGPLPETDFSEIFK